MYTHFRFKSSGLASWAVTQWAPVPSPLRRFKPNSVRHDPFPPITIDPPVSLIDKTSMGQSLPPALLVR